MFSHETDHPKRMHQPLYMLPQTVHIDSNPSEMLHAILYDFIVFYLFLRVLLYYS